MADMSAFQVLPIQDLIGGPLIGAAQGQAKLAQITWILLHRWHLRKTEKPQN